MEKSFIKTKRKTNIDMFNQCIDKIRCCNYRLIEVLIDMYNKGDIIITNKSPDIKGDYIYRNYYMSSLVMNEFVLKLSKQIKKELKHDEALDILMYNFLNKR